MVLRTCFLVPLLLVVTCGTISAILLTMPDKPWTAQSFPVNSSVCGKWEVLAEPNLGIGADGGSINGIAARAEGELWLTGWAENADFDPLFFDEIWPLMIHWDNRHLSKSSAPAVAGPWSRMSDVAIVSEDDVWAVGSEYYRKILILHWNGDGWTRIAGPLTSTGHADVEAVTAIASDDVWAVGCCDGNAPLVMHWDGMGWSITPHPSFAAPGFTLYDVAAISANDVWAVGTYDDMFTLSDNGNGKNTLTTHWNGSIWEVVPSPNLCRGRNTLTAVSATGSKDIWAVGNCTDDSSDSYVSQRQPLILHWNGTTWSSVAGPNSVGRHQLSGVAAISPNDVWAVGAVGLVDRTLVIHWDGKQWSDIPTPNLAREQWFNDVVAVSKDEIWAVGKVSENPLVTRFIRNPCPIP